jgi:tetratricopeptide (TPR) repeat protein
MNAWTGLVAAGAFAAALGVAGPALADFSACDSAFTATDVHQQINLWTICITKSGLTGADRAGAFNNRGNAYRRIGEEEKAFQDFTWSIEADPNWGTAYLNRGHMYERRGDWAHAVADFEKAGHLSPIDVRAEALNDEAWLLATCSDREVRNGPKAVELAQKAISYKDGPAQRDTLAAAYAQSGKFDDAVREESKAIELLKAKTPTAETAGFEQRLELYRSGMPLGPGAPPAS